jgi:dTDP-glucose 4,6-dehydratase
MRNPLAEDLDFVLAKTADVWQELRGKRLFITGGTGFFGCWLLESLCWANDQLGVDVKATVLSRSPQKFALKAAHLANHPSITWVTGDVRDFDFPPGTFDYVIHAASESDLAAIQQDATLQFDTILEGTRRVLQFAATHGTQKLLFTSSGAVYGKQPAELSHVPEDYAGAPDPCLPSSAYGEAKRAAENLCVLYAQQFGFEVKIARCFAFVGPYLPLDANFAVGNFIRDALKGGPIVIQGDGTPLRSYLYAADLAVWLWTILVKGQNCRPYNVGSDEAISIRELAERVREVTLSGGQILIGQKTHPGVKPFQYVPSIKRGIKDLGLASWTSLNRGIEKTKDFITSTKLLLDRS